MKIKFKSGERTYIMKVIEVFKNGDVRVINSTIVEKKDIIETIKN